MGKQVNDLIEQLLSSLTETIGVLSHLSDAELDDLSEHPCAMGGTVRDLLNHNIDHEQMHTGQIYSLRYSLRKMQKGQVDRLMVETLRARANLIASLIGLDDKDLDAQNPDDEWTIRQMIEHTLYWERHSIDDLADTKLGRRLPADRPRAGINVTDPLAGPLIGPEKLVPVRDQSNDAE
ncbi:MAG TPA: DinB family protein [Anaerolineales bacterium]|nr:DinB family protein [Anaerolineales bacterium]